MWCRSWKYSHQRGIVHVTYHEKVRVQIGDLDGSSHQNRVRGESEPVIGTGAIDLITPVCDRSLSGEISDSAETTGAETLSGGNSHTREEECLGKETANLI